MTELDLKITTTPALKIDPVSGNGYLDPANHKFCFEHMAGGIHFSTPWQYGNDQRVAQMRKRIEADLGLELEVRDD